MESEDEELFNFRSLKRYKSSEAQNDSDMLTTSERKVASSNKHRHSLPSHTKQCQQHNDNSVFSSTELFQNGRKPNAVVEKNISRRLRSGIALPGTITDFTMNENLIATSGSTYDTNYCNGHTGHQNVVAESICPQLNFVSKTFENRSESHESVDSQISTDSKQALSKDFPLSDQTLSDSNCLQTNGLLAKNNGAVTTLKIANEELGLFASAEDPGCIKSITKVLENRCPFCQLPFHALSGQPGYRHTMECMDSGLASTKDCPAGLGCNSIIPSHYRRYNHRVIACHLAGQYPTKPEDIESGGVKNVQVLPHQDHHSMKAKTADVIPQKHYQSRNPKRQKKTKLASQSLKRRKECSLPETLPNQNLESQTNASASSNSSIKTYFSPSGKRKDSPDQVKETYNKAELDPVLKLLVMSDSDTELSNSNNQNDEDEEGDKADIEMSNKTNSNNQNDEDEEGDKADTEEFTVDCADLLKRKSGGSKETDLDLELLADNSPVTVRIERAETNLITDDLGVKMAPVTVRTETAETNLTTNDLGVKMPPSHCHEGTCQNLSYNLSGLPGKTVTLHKQASLFTFFKPHYPKLHCKVNQSPAKLHCKVNQSPSKLHCKVNQMPQRQGELKHGKKLHASVTKSLSEPVNTPSATVPLKNATPTDRLKSAAFCQQSAGDANYFSPVGRQCPFYKRLPGTSITVDAFCYGEIAGCQAYVLTHFHSDHYRGLTKRFSRPLYCSSVTANLVEKQIGVASQWVNRLPLNIPTQVAGVWLLLMEANHCPGSVIILFELPNGRKLLHTGDFRADVCMEQYAPLVGITVDELYLDTTYCDPSYTFPSQKATIEFAVSVAKKTKEQEPRTLIVCGAYTIGKERIFIALAQALQTKVCVQPAKKKVLDCLQDQQLQQLVSLDWTDGCVHVLPMRQLTGRSLEQHLQLCPQFNSILAFEPTGWTYSNKSLSLDTLRPKYSRHGITIYGVPYSEHSSFLELKRFVQFLRPKKIIPTVNNGNPISRRKMQTTFSQWLAECATHSLQSSKLSSAPVQQSLGSWLKI